MESMTDTKAYWVAPYLQKTANTQKRLVEIDFASPAAKTPRLNQSLSDCQTNTLSPSSTKNRYKPPPPLPINLSNLYSDLNN